MLLELGIAEKVFLDIGNTKQGMIIESQSLENPVLLVLHGGPGSTEYAAFKAYNVGLEKLFTVCYWEQRGSGISFNSEINPNTMTLKQLISDAIEITNYLQERFVQDKIYIMGHSWGTLLGSYVINQNPDLYHAYIGIGQVANTKESEKEIYNFMVSAATDNHDKLARKKLQEWNVNDETIFFDANYLAMRMKYVLKYGGGIVHSETSMVPFIKQLFFCKTYTIGEKIKFIQGSAFSGKLMTHYVISANLIEELPTQKVPVYIFAGKYDYQTTYNQALEYYEMLQAPDKGFYTFDNSAHSPMLEEPKLFVSILEKDVIK